MRWSRPFLLQGLSSSARAGNRQHGYDLTYAYLNGSCVCTRIGTNNNYKDGRREHEWEVDGAPRGIDSWAVTVRFRWSSLRTGRFGSAAKARACWALWLSAGMSRSWRGCMAPAQDNHAYATLVRHRAQIRLPTSNSYFKSCISSDCCHQKQKDRYTYNEPCCMSSKSTNDVNRNGARNPQKAIITLSEGFKGRKRPST